MNFIGLAGRGGGLGEKIAVQRRWVHPIADSVPLDEGFDTLIHRNETAVKVLVSPSGRGL